MNDLDYFLLCLGYNWWAAFRGEGPSGAFVTHCSISYCSVYFSVHKIDIFYLIVYRMNIHLKNILQFTE